MVSIYNEPNSGTSDWTVWKFLKQPFNSYFKLPEILNLSNEKIVKNNVFKYE